MASTARGTLTPEEKPDPRFIPVARAFARTAGFSLMESKSGVTCGLMLNGKSFGMSTHGRFVLKLNPERCAVLISEGIGRAFEPSPGKPMKGWIEISDPEADWVALAREACQLAKTATKPFPKKKASS